MRTLFKKITMKQFYFLLFTFFALNLSFGQVLELYFSKYGEGSGDNKFIEIYNGTDQEVNLDNYAFPNVSNANIFTDIKCKFYFS